MNGPFLYDDDPTPLHTGTPRRARGAVLWIFGSTAAFAVLMAVLLLAVKGSGEEQAQEVTGVFLAALAQDDTETAHQLLCEEERARLTPAEVAGAYLGEGAGTTGTPREDGDAIVVPVRWADGTTTELAVVAEDGPRVCGAAVPD